MEPIEVRVMDILRNHGGQAPIRIVADQLKAEGHSDTDVSEAILQLLSRSELILTEERELRPKELVA